MSYTSDNSKRILASVALAGAVVFGGAKGLEYLIGNSEKIPEKVEQVQDEEEQASDMQRRLEEYFPEDLKLLTKEVSERDRYEGFKFQDEMFDILKHSQRVGVEPELLMAIRSAENGSDNIAYGIMPQGSLKERYDADKGYELNGKFVGYNSEKEKQLCWSAQTIKKNLKKFEQNDEGQKDFIDYLADVWAPIGVENDPNGLNENWEGNVRYFYNECDTPCPEGQGFYAWCKS